MNKWAMVPPAVVTHLCLGSIYSWSIINQPLMRDLGVLASSSGDWTLPMVLPIFSVVLGLHGLSAAFLGKWQEAVGPRVSCMIGALCYGGGIALGGVGVMMHNLPLLYLGAGVLTGLGMGFSYVPPIATLVKWFPKNRGLATGLTIMGFGGGALVTTPIQTALLAYFRKAPEFVGAGDHLQTVLVDGARFVDVGGELREVVYATAQDLVNFPGLTEGFYLVGTGSTGAALTLMCMGASFFVCMATSSLLFRTYPTPAPQQIAHPVQSPATAAANATPAAVTSGATAFNVHFQDAMRTPQFWQVWVVFASLATAGMATISVAKTMIGDLFVQQYPLIVTGAFTSACVMGFSVANLFGRLYWSSLSDRVGRPTIIKLFTLASVPLYLTIPATVASLAYTTSPLPLVVFLAASSAIISFFGGIYSVCPAYESDLFGSKYFGAIHGRMLTASAFGAIVGPVVLAKLRQYSELSAIRDLAAKLDPAAFLERFGAPISELEALMETKVVTINTLLPLCPAGTLDPTPFLYDSTMYFAATIVAIASVVSFFIRPVNAKYHEKIELQELTPQTQSDLKRAIGQEQGKE